MRKLALVIHVFAFAAACSGDAVVRTVRIRDFKFEPATLRVEPGTTVEWTSRDSVLHTVTSGSTSGPENSPDGLFDGKLPNKGESFSYTFAETGTYTYFCRQHNVMNGTIQVRRSDG